SAEDTGSRRVKVLPPSRDSYTPSCVAARTCSASTAVRAWGRPPGTVPDFLHVVPPSVLRRRPPAGSTPYRASAVGQDRKARTCPAPAPNLRPPSVLAATPSSVVASTTSRSFGLTAMSRAASSARSSQDVRSALTRSRPRVLSPP